MQIILRPQAKFQKALVMLLLPSAQRQTLIVVRLLFPQGGEIGGELDIFVKWSFRKTDVQREELPVWSFLS